MAGELLANLRGIGRCCIHGAVVLRAWLKSRAENCWGGRCGCSVSQKSKKDVGNQQGGVIFLIFKWIHFIFLIALAN